MFNTPLTCVKTTQGWKVMQDFRELNRYLTKEHEQFKGVQELIGPVATNQSAVFSTIDLSSSAWQLKLSPEQQELTAFSCPGSGQFVWKQAPLHLAGASATFHRIISAMFENQVGIIPHIDKIIIHTPDADQHFRLLRHVLQKLDSRQLTLNLARSSFFTDTATVMGFRLKNGQYVLRPEPLHSLAAAPAPTTTAMVKSFLGLTNFFRAQILELCRNRGSAQRPGQDYQPLPGRTTATGGRSGLREAQEHPLLSPHSVSAPSGSPIRGHCRRLHRPRVCQGRHWSHPHPGGRGQPFPHHLLRLPAPQRQGEATVALPVGNGSGSLGHPALR